MTTAVSIRLFRLSDLDRVLEIEHASFGKDAYDRNLFADYHRHCGALFLVAEKDRNIRGYMVTCALSRAASPRAELISVAVEPEQRGKGIASALLDSTLRRLRRRGIVRFTLTVRVDNESAIRLYQRYGFRKSRVVRGYYEDGADGQRMVKCLN
jgi:[ribosomal protein S18]-alanine N-acetyltransferase